jgi:hypothetical protein
MSDKLERHLALTGRLNIAKKFLANGWRMVNTCGSGDYLSRKLQLSTGRYLV